MIHYEVDGELNTERAKSGYGEDLSLAISDGPLNLFQLKSRPSDAKEAESKEAELKDADEAVSTLGRHLDYLAAIDWDYARNGIVNAVTDAADAGEDYRNLRSRIWEFFYTQGLLATKNMFGLVFYSDEFSFLKKMIVREDYDLNLARMDAGVNDIKERLEFIRTNAARFNAEPDLYQTAVRLKYGIDIRKSDGDTHVQDAYALIAIGYRLAAEYIEKRGRRSCDGRVVARYKRISLLIAHDRAKVDDVKAMRRFLLSWVEEAASQECPRNEIRSLIKRSMQFLPPDIDESAKMRSGAMGPAISFDFESLAANEQTLCVMREMSRYQVGFREEYGSLADFITASAAKCYEAGKKFNVCQVCDRLFVAQKTNNVMCDRPFWKRDEVMEPGSATCRQINVSKKKDRNIAPKTKARVKSDFSQRLKRRLKKATDQACAGNVSYLAVLEQFFSHLRECSEDYWANPNYSSSIVANWLTESCAVLTDAGIEAIVADKRDCRLPVKRIELVSLGGKQVAALLEDERRFSITGEDESRLIDEAESGKSLLMWTGF